MMHPHKVPKDMNQKQMDKQLISNPLPDELETWSN